MSRHIVCPKVDTYLNAKGIALSTGQRRTLATYPTGTQMKWAVNPLIQGWIEGYINMLLEHYREKGMVPGGGTPSSSTTTTAVIDKPIIDSSSSSDSGSDQPPMTLFDDNDY